MRQELRLESRDFASAAALAAFRARAELVRESLKAGGYRIRNLP